VRYLVPRAQTLRGTEVKRAALRIAVAGLAALASAQSSFAQQLLPGERAASVTEIPGVIAAGATWELVWADFETADGIVGTPDGGVIFAQEQTDTIRKLDANNRELVYLTDTHGAGSVSLDAQGRLYAVQRTCTDPGRPFSAACQELTRVSMLAPEQKLLANSFRDGKPTPRAPITIAFSGAEKKMLYVPMMGAVGPNGKPWTTPDGVRNTAMTIYRIPVLAEGFRGRPK
jgi:sugar lactone lactonase YvrE